jgi:glycosidase
MGEDFIFGITSYSDTVARRRQAELRTVWHAHRINPRDPLPGQPVEITVDVGTGYRADAVFGYWSAGDRQPCGRGGVAQQGQVVALEMAGIEWDDLAWGYVERWHGTLPPQPEGTRVSYRVEAWDAHQRRSAFADSGAEDPAGEPPFAYHVDRWRPPDWIRDAFVYHIMVDRFHPGDGRSWRDTTNLNGIVGGTLRGIVDKLPYIASLGANALWISPISEGPSWHHYDTTDHRTVAAHLGTNADFCELVYRAHAMGMRVILDLVVHATSDKHPFLKAAQADPASPYCQWYTFSCWPDEYDCFFGAKVLPHLNLEHAPAREYITATALQWVKDYQVDGLRLDYAIKPSHSFWVHLQSALRAERADTFTVGEAVASPLHLHTFEGKLDGCLDFAWAEAARATFAHRTHDLASFERFLSRHEAYAGPDFVRPTFIDNHDMNRILFIAGGDTRRVKLAAACQFTLSQPPIVLYGTEVGLSQREDCRADLDVVREPMPWNEAQDRDLLAFYRRLGAARRAHAPLRRGSRRTLYVDHETLLYSKGEGSEACVVALHIGDQPKEVTVQLEASPVTYWDVLSDAAHASSDDKLPITLQPWEAAILVPE